MNNYLFKAIWWNNFLVEYLFKQTENNNLYLEERKKREMQSLPGYPSWFKSPAFSIANPYLDSGFPVNFTGSAYSEIP